jgi:hypothetical protein
LQDGNFCFKEETKMMLPSRTFTRRRNSIYRFRSDERTLDCTCAEFSRMTGIGADHVDHLAKGRAASVRGIWRCEGFFRDGQLVPVVFCGSPRRVFAFRKVTTGHTIFKTRADMVRFLGVRPNVVYRAIRKQTRISGDWLIVGRQI